MSNNPQYTKDAILGVVIDSVTDLLYYRRKEDEVIPVGTIERALSIGIVTVEEIVLAYEMGLLKQLEE